MDAPQKIDFPCDYPIKVMVREGTAVRQAVTAVIERHAGTGAAGRCSERLSSEGRFAGLTYTIRATGTEHIAALFLDLRAIPGVMLVL
jgi:putative lipoic acid-binding regulatory protein